MINKKTQNLKKFMYVSSTLCSLMISSEIQARANFSEDWINYPVNGGHIPIPKLRKNIVHDLEGANHPFPPKFKKTQEPEPQPESQGHIPGRTINPIKYIEMYVPFQFLETLATIGKSFFLEKDIDGNIVFDDPRY